MNNFLDFVAKILNVSVGDIVELELVGAYSVDIRKKKPNLYANAIMFWCWLRKAALRKIGWLRRWHHCAGVERWIARLRDGSTVLFAVSYDASETYERNDFRKWVKAYDIINICDTHKSLNIDTIQKKLRVHINYEKMIGTPYGKDTILGLVVDDITRIQVIGINGKEKVICSESEMWVYEEFLPEPDEPRDHIDVIERGKYFGMEPYNGELNSYM